MGKGWSRDPPTGERRFLASRCLLLCKCTLHTRCLDTPHLQVGVYQTVQSFVGKRGPIGDALHPSCGSTELLTRDYGERIYLKSREGSCYISVAIELSPDDSHWGLWPPDSMIATHMYKDAWRHTTRYFTGNSDSEMIGKRASIPCLLQSWKENYESELKYKWKQERWWKVSHE